MKLVGYSGDVTSDVATPDDHKEVEAGFNSSDLKTRLRYKKVLGTQWQTQL